MIVHEKGVEDSWKECMKRLMNEDGEWEHGVSAEVKGGGTSRLHRDRWGCCSIEKDEGAWGSRFVRVVGGNDTGYRECWNSVVVGFVMVL